MMRLISILFFCLCILGDIFSQNKNIEVVPFRSGDLWGLSSVNGEIFLEPRFDKVRIGSSRIFMSYSDKGGSVYDFYGKLLNESSEVYFPTMNFKKGYIIGREGDSRINKYFDYDLNQIGDTNFQIVYLQNWNKCYLYLFKNEDGDLGVGFTDFNRSVNTTRVLLKPDKFKKEIDEQGRIIKYTDSEKYIYQLILKGKGRLKLLQRESIDIEALYGENMFADEMYSSTLNNDCRTIKYKIESKDIGSNKYIVYVLELECMSSSRFKYVVSDSILVEGSKIRDVGISKQSRGKKIKLTREESYIIYKNKYDKYGMINYNNDTILPFKYNYISNSLFTASDKTNFMTRAVINKRKVVVDLTDKVILEYSDGQVFDFSMLDDPLNEYEANFIFSFKDSLGIEYIVDENFKKVIDQPAKVFKYRGGKYKVVTLADGRQGTVVRSKFIEWPKEKFFDAHYVLPSGEIIFHLKDSSTYKEVGYMHESGLKYYTD